MLTVTLKNTEQTYLVKLTLESKAQMIDLWSAKKLNNESSYVIKNRKKTEQIKTTNNPAQMQNKEKKTPLNWILITVILLHIIVISAISSSKTDEVKVTEQLKSMTVSLLSDESKAKEPVLQKHEPVKQKQKNEKKITNPEHDLTKAEPQVKTTKAEAEVASQQVDQVAESKPAIIESSDNLVKEEHEEKATKHVKPVEETAIDQPKFDVAYLNNPAPVYPKMSRRLGEQGRVMLKVLVSENGIAEQVQLDTSSGYEKLDQAAIDAVKKWSFVPAKKSNQAISAYVLVPVKFSLNS